MVKGTPNIRHAQFADLNYNSGFEMPIMNTEGFLGWTTDQNGTGTVYTGYHVLSEFSGNIDGSTKTLMLWAKSSS